MKAINVKNNPLKWVPTVYFAEGLPFVILSAVSVLMFSDMNVSNAQIAFWTSLIMLPWTIKPLWSPFMEVFGTKKFYVIITEIITGVCFGLIALSLNLPDFFGIAIALMAVIAFSGASHDIAVDGLYLTELDTNKQAKYIGWQGAFYNLAKILCNGGLVFVAGRLAKSVGPQYSWMVIMAICGGLMTLLGIYHRFTLPSRANNAVKMTSAKEGLSALGETFGAFFKKKHIAWYISFIILYRFAEGYAIKIVPLFLKAPISEGGLGLSIESIGLIYGTCGTIAFIVGSILAGYYVSSRGLKKTLFSLCCVFNIPFVVYLFLSIYQPSSIFIVGSAVTFEYFGYGFGFVGLMLFMMQQIAPGKYKMAHYAFCSGIMNLGVMIPGMMSGAMSDWMGYKGFFIWVMIATIPAFIATYFVPFSYKDGEQPQS